jgi:TonB family protein
MLFEKDEALELQPRRTKTLSISIGLHLLLVAVIAFNPDIFTFTPKRVIRIAGQDYDLSKTQLTELILPPPDQLRPKPPSPAPDRPLVQPPVPAPQPRVEPPPPQPPPPPPPPPPQQSPPVTISPDDVIAEGARPDGQSRPSRGDTTEAARAGGSPEPPKPEPTPKQQGPADPPQIARNTNPNAIRLPSLRESAGRIIEESVEEARRRYGQGPRTGLPGVQIDPNFSTEEPTILSDTKGYDFGPYMNAVVNRVRINWYSLIPEIARLGKKGRVVIIFKITENGTIENVEIVANSGTEPLDRAALGAITASNPFARLPGNFSGDNLVLQFTFLYNIR